MAKTNALTNKSSAAWEFGGSGSDVASVLGIDAPDWFYNMSDEACQRTQQLARDTSNQRKKVAIATKSYEKVFADRTSMVQAVHGMLRTGLKEVFSQRKEYAKTAEALAKFNADSEVLAHETRNEIGNIDYEKNARIGLADKNTALDRQEIDHRYKSLADLSLHKLQQRKSTITAQIAARKQETQPPAWLLQG